MEEDILGPWSVLLTINEFSGPHLGTSFSQINDDNNIQIIILLFWRFRTTGQGLPTIVLWHCLFSALFTRPRSNFSLDAIFHLETGIIWFSNEQNTPTKSSDRSSSLSRSAPSSFSRRNDPVVLQRLSPDQRTKLYY